MHRLLSRQLKWIYGKSFDPAGEHSLDRSLLDYISDTYYEHDKERRHFEHTLDLNTSELNHSNADLKKVLGLLSEAQRISRTGSWSLTLVSGQLELSQELYRIAELDDDVIEPQRQYASLIHQDDRSKADIHLRLTLRQKRYDDFYRLDFGNGRIKYVHEHREVITSPTGKNIAVLGVIQDVTAQKKADTELHLYASVFRNSGESIVICDQQKSIIAVNQTFVQHTGYTGQDLQQQKIDTLISADVDDSDTIIMNGRLASEGFWQGELQICKKNGARNPVRISISVIYDENNRISNYIASFTDISERKESEKRIHFLAHHDALTGLVNRFSFEEIVSQALHSARREKTQLAILFIDMDRFKTINDTLGHQAGDMLLVEIANRLKSSVRTSDIVGRLGGDEFVICLTNLHRDLDALHSVHLITQTLNAPYFLNGQEVHSSPSIGISVYPNNGIDFETLMINADSAMYHAKELGRNTHQFYSESLNAVANRRLELENALRTAIEDEEFELVYQPQICAEDFRVCGMEALIRWNSASLGPIPPGQFIAIAEETRLIIALGKWVLEQACSQHHAWKQESPDLPKVAVNISTQQLRSTDLVSTIGALMNKYDMQAGDLEIEVTEASLMENPDVSIRRLQELRNIGVSLAIDDFGTGYSSLAYLKLLPIHSLKLDRSFVNGLEANPDNAEICSATLALAHNLGLSVVAEGVETAAQQDFLVSLNCEKLQGYYYSKPLPPAEILPFLHNTQARPKP